MRVTRSRLRLVVVGVALALLLLTQLFAVVLSGVSANRSALGIARAGIAREGETTVEAILRHLEPAEQSTNLTARLLGDRLLDMTEPGLERYLYTQLRVIPQLAGAFVGFPDGSFVFVSREGPGFRIKRITAGPPRAVAIHHLDADFVEINSETTPDDPFDPRKRPWYERASGTEELIWTAPYVFFTSRRPGVTAARAVRVDGELAAVVGVDIELSALASLMDHLTVSENGEAFVISGPDVVAAPSRYEAKTGMNEDGSLRLLTTAELGVAALDRVGTNDIGVVRDGRDLVLGAPFPLSQGPKWTVVIRAPVSDFTDVVRKQQQFLLFIWVAGIGLIGLSALVMLRVTRPVDTLADLALTDPLTGIGNRRSMVQEGERLVVEAARKAQLVSVMIIDLDRFKEVNDAFGHAAGDGALKMVAQHLRFVVGQGVVCRLGGDEFAILRLAPSVAEALGTGEAVLAGLVQKLRSFVPGVELGASAGLAVGEPGLRRFDKLLREADAALIVQKATGKGAVGLAQPASAAAV